MYALLLGSGVSRAATIPTGWEVVLDLIGRLAAMQDADVSGDPVTWYEREFGAEPDYSKILARLARHPDERQRLLRGYFEPSEEERDEGAKEPTAAHRAIAALCRRKYIRVIVTTNFDRLLEQALVAEGLQPTVVSTADAVRGAPPLVHADLLIIKIHGDYLDTRIRNTTGELESYPRPMARLLDRVFDEFGLVVCGWSARWDPALRGALERCRNQRYTTYWTGVEDPDQSLQDLLRLRRADFIRIGGADEFFEDLNEKIEGLEEHARPHPLSVRAAVASVKRYLPEPRHDIRFNDLLSNEAKRIMDEAGGGRFALSGQPDATNVASRVKAYEDLTEILRSVFATACFWADSRHEPTLTRLVEDMSAHPSTGGNTFWLDLRFYPAFLLLYAGGIAAVANAKHGVLRAMWLDPVVRRGNESLPAVLGLNREDVLKDDHAKILPGMERKNTPVSQWLQPVLRSSLQEVLPLDGRYERALDRFEYLWGLVHADLYVSPWQDQRVWGPLGSFVWRGWGSDHPSEIIGREIETLGAEWPLLKEGFFAGDLERLKKAKVAFDEFWQGLNLRW
ncbi:MAG: SIR2 family protein [Gemmatimonadota bacterium]